MKLSKEVLKGHIDTLILSILASKDCYGYEIAKNVRVKCNGAFELKEGTMYLALKRLESKSLVKSYWGEEISEGGRRKYYTITSQGIDMLSIKKEEWNLIQNIMNLFLMEDK